jgi:hypothetical protein
MPGKKPFAFGVFIGRGKGDSREAAKGKGRQRVLLRALASSREALIRIRRYAYDRLAQSEQAAAYIRLRDHIAVVPGSIWRSLAKTETWRQGLSKRSPKPKTGSDSRDP